MSTHIYGPHGTVRTLYPASDKQLDFLRKLQDERVVDDKLATDIAFELEQPGGPGKYAVSQLIDDLMEAPKRPAFRTGPTQKASLPDVPAGRYAVEGSDGKLRFVKVDRPDDGAWAGWTFVSVQAGDEFFRLRGEQPAKALAAITAYGVKAAAIRYGHELGECGICGRTLTNEASRLAGIGPVCLAKMGW